MIGFLIRTLITALGLWLATAIVPGVDIVDNATLAWAAVLLGVVNAIIRPLLIVLTLPITFVTLGLFLLVVNAGMFGLVAWLLDGFHVSGFFPSFFGAIVVGISAWFASGFIGPKGRYQVVVKHHD